MKKHQLKPTGRARGAVRRLNKILAGSGCTASLLDGDVIAFDHARHGRTTYKPTASGEWTRQRLAEVGNSIMDMLP